MAPLSLSHYSLEGEDYGQDEKVGKYCGLLRYRKRVSCVWEEGEGELASENCKGMCKTRVLDQQKCKAK